MSIVTSAISLFLVFNVLGNIPFYIAVLRPFNQKRQQIILFREMLIALGILLLFGFFGDYVLSALGISQAIIGVSGGLLLFLISLSMIFPKETSGGDSEVFENEPLIVPLAIPAMAGPGSIAAVMLYSKELETSPLFIFLVILLAWLPSLALVLSASYIRKLVGNKGLVAFERLGGLLISLISVQMITSGIIQIVKANF